MKTREKILDLLKQNGSLDDEEVGYSEELYGFTRYEFIDFWEELATEAGYDPMKPDNIFCYKGFDEKRIFMERKEDGFQFILRELTCGQVATQMCLPSDEHDMAWENEKKTVFTLGSLSTKKKKPKLVCPRCGSTEVEPASTIPTDGGHFVSPQGDIDAPNSCWVCGHDWGWPDEK